MVRDVLLRGDVLRMRERSGGGSRGDVGGVYTHTVRDSSFAAIARGW